MPLRIIRNDITKVETDAIVNTANPKSVIGAGTDSAVYKAAGKDLLLAERKKIGDIPVGKAAVTSAFALNAKYIIHTVGPVWTGGDSGEEAALRSCYAESLQLAKSLLCESIAFPLISSGSYGFPKDLAIKTATSAIYDFLMENDMMVYLVVFDKKAFELSGKLFEDVKAYIDENYYNSLKASEYALESRNLSCAGSEELERMRRYRQFLAAHPQPAKQPTLEEWMGGASESFSSYLMQLIDKSGFKTNKEVYARAGLTRQAFSKIYSGKVMPSKNSVCALALALKLDLETAGSLLAKAGMALSDSEKFDLLIKYCLKYGIYDVMEINEMLYELDLPQLGSRQTE